MDSEWQRTWEQALRGFLAAALGGEQIGPGTPVPGTGTVPEPTAASRAFLAALAGGPAAAGPAAFLHTHAQDDTPVGRLARLYESALAASVEEVARHALDEPAFRHQVRALAAAMTVSDSPGQDDLTEHCWRVFFPEGAGIRGRLEEAIQSLRQRRTVTIATVNPRPLDDPARQILWTANALLTVPLNDVHRARIPTHLRADVEAAAGQRQRFWYDHPVPLGASEQDNEVVYGLRGLDEAFRFEKARGTMAPDARPTVLLSVSVTHEGLQRVAGRYVAAELAAMRPIEHLRVLVVTECEARQFVDDVLSPAGRTFLRRVEPESLRAVFGVDGEYGRHYSFLKAVAPLYALLADRRCRATFKIDLDQVFPQAALVRETGQSALEHFRTPLWGGLGRDWQGRPVELGLIAGALVNDRDIRRSLFTPDVEFPDRQAVGDELVFWSAIPQALSTRAEMMARGPAGPKGVTHCLQRVHVTGGTNGILIDSLRRHRPFTPTFVGRAEDQAYLLSVLDRDGPALRYLHQPGLIMRHDKHSFASEAIEAAATGKLVGDYVRQVLFSRYARALPWPFEAIKAQMDPFTGCFISHLPVTVVCLRLAIRAAYLEKAGRGPAAAELLALGAERLLPLLASDADAQLAACYRGERAAWDLYFDILDAFEAALERDDPAATKLAERGRALFASCQCRPDA